MIFYMFFLYTSVLGLGLGKILTSGLSKFSSGGDIKLHYKALCEHTNTLFLITLEDSYPQYAKRWAPRLPRLPHHEVTIPESNAMVYAAQPDEH